MRPLTKFQDSMGGWMAGLKPEEPYTSQATDDPQSNVTRKNNDNQLAYQEAK